MHPYIIEMTGSMKKFLSIANYVKMIEIGRKQSYGYPIDFNVEKLKMYE